VNRPLVLGRFRGVEIVLDVSMLLLTLLLVVSLYADLVSGSGGGGTATIVFAALGGVLFLGGVVLHELSHTQLALQRGLDVTRIRLFLLGGVSEIQEEAATPGDELAIAVAGPITSGLLGGGLVALTLLIPETWDQAGRVVLVSGWAHLALAVFNVLPGFPLDGGRALRALLWSRRGDKEAATMTTVRVGRQFGLVVIGVGAWLAIRGLVVVGMWAALVGWFVNRTATTAAARERFLSKVRGHTLREVMRPITETVDENLTVERLVDLYTVGPRLATQAVEHDGRIVALIGEEEIADLDAAARAATRVADVMVHVGPDDVATADTDLVDLLQRASSPSRRVLVTEGQRAIGVVTSDEFGRFLRAT
jgi:Zn-dependent protease